MKHYTCTAAPESDPVSATEAIGFIRGAASDETERAFIETLIATSREVIELFTGRVLMESEWLMACDSWRDAGHYCRHPQYGYGFRPVSVTLDRSPLVSVETVKYYPADGGSLVTLSPGSDYIVITGTTPGRIQLLIDPPAVFDRADAIQIAFTAGAEAPENVPAILIHAMRLLVSHLYENRLPLVIGNIVNELPYSLKHLLESQRVGGWSA